MRNAFSTAESGPCAQQCEQLGVAQVRALLRREDLAEPHPGWRREAQQWLDARLAREGVVAYWGVLGAISVLGVVILCMAWWRW